MAVCRVLCPGFGVLYGGSLAAVGSGGVHAPVGIHGMGLRGAVAASGALLPAVALVLYRRLTRVDEHASVPEAELDLIRSISLFEPPPPTSLEKLARAAVRARVPAGANVVREGMSGGRRLRDLTARDFFGEIALLRDVARTATVEARSDATLLVVHR